MPVPSRWEEKTVLYNPQKKLLSKYFKSLYKNVISEEQKNFSDFYSVVISKNIDQCYLRVLI